jgi:hypothetical protein
MATFLTNPKMNGALADRVRASVRQGQSRGARVHRSWTVVFRLAAVVGITLSLISLSVLRKRENDQLEQARKALLDTVSQKRAQLSVDDMLTLERALNVLLRAPGPYEGDRVASEVGGAGALGAVLERPFIYVRGPIDAFEGEDALRRAALLSYPDAFARCLVDPPRSRTEKALLERIRGASDPPIPTVQTHRLYDLLAGIPLLRSAWKATVLETKQQKDLSRFERELRAAKLDETAAAARSRLLLFVMDEPSGPGGPTELDGERPHDVRVTLFDLEQRNALLRLRHHVDPSAFSDRGRAGHASGLDSCALSIDVREAAAKGDALTEAARAR